MNLSYYLFGIKATAPGTPAVVLPAVSVAETHTYNSADNSMSVTWKLLFSKPLTGSVNVRHSGTDDGQPEEWPWGVEGESWQGSYTYDLDNMPGLGSLTFEALAGTGYMIGSPASVSIDVSAYTGGGTTNPPPPLGSGDAVEFMIEDTQMQTLWFMPAVGACSVDHEYQIGTGAVTSCPGNELDLYGLTIPIGGFKLRKKALNGSPAGAWVYNTKAYTAPNIVYSGPLTITQGGTYIGNWESTNPAVPAVDIRTGEPVRIVSSNIKYAGRGINYSRYGSPDPDSGDYNGCRVTIENVRAVGVDCGYTTEQSRIFCVLEHYYNVNIHHNFVTGSGGVLVTGTYKGNSTMSETVKIVLNRAVNLDDSRSPDKLLRRLGNFAKIDNNQGQKVPFQAISDNHVHQHMHKSSIEDAIGVSAAEGTTESPIEVHNNLVRGLSYWFYQRKDASYNPDGFSGVCLMVESVAPTNTDTCAQNIDARGNVWLDSNGGFMSNCSAINAKYEDNIIVSKGRADKGDYDMNRDVHGGEFRMNSGYPSTNDDQYHNLGTAAGVVFNNNKRAVAQHYSVSENKNTATAGGRMESHFPGTGTVLVQETNPQYLYQAIPITEEQVNEQERAWWQRQLAAGNNPGPVAVTVTAAPAA